MQNLQKTLFANLGIQIRENLLLLGNLKKILGPSLGKISLPIGTIVLHTHTNKCEYHPPPTHTPGHKGCTSKDIIGAGCLASSSLHHFACPPLLFRLPWYTDAVFTTLVVNNDRCLLPYFYGASPGPLFSQERMRLQPVQLAQPG